MLCPTYHLIPALTTRETNRVFKFESRETMLNQIVWYSIYQLSRFESISIVTEKNLRDQIARTFNKYEVGLKNEDFAFSSKPMDVNLSKVMNLQYGDLLSGLLDHFKVLQGNMIPGESLLLQAENMLPHNQLSPQNLDLKHIGLVIKDLTEKASLFINAHRDYVNQNHQNSIELTEYEMYNLNKRELHKSLTIFVNPKPSEELSDVHQIEFRDDNAESILREQFMAPVTTLKIEESQEIQLMNRLSLTGSYRQANYFSQCIDAINSTYRIFESKTISVVSFLRKAKTDYILNKFNLKEISHGSHENTLAAVLSNSNKSRILLLEDGLFHKRNPSSYPFQLKLAKELEEAGLKLSRIYNYDILLQGTSVFSDIVEHIEGER